MGIALEPPRSNRFQPHLASIASLSQNSFVPYPHKLFISHGSKSGKFNASFVDLCSGDEEASFQTGTTINSENTLQDNKILGWNSDTDEFEAEAQRKKNQ